VPSGRAPHSLHGYYLLKGDSTKPTVFRVECDRDGGSFSARRVVAMQDGAVIFSMSSSFHARAGGWESQCDAMPATGDVADLRSTGLFGLMSLEGRVPEQPYDSSEWPTRFLARTTAPLPSGDELLHACAVTYASDVSHGVLPAADGSSRARSSLDHAVWFHRPVDASAWMLYEFQPRTSGHGRAWYSGFFLTEDGALVASVAQEMLHR
jgi:acyl-CoA thioesterase-2